MQRLLSISTIGFPAAARLTSDCWVLRRALDEDDRVALIAAFPVSLPAPA
jgi:hypothetical protein